MLNFGLFAATFSVVFLAELPDKSLFASLVLGTRYPAKWVWIGVTAAFAVHVVIAVAAGGVLSLLPHTLVEVIVAVLFAAGAALLLLQSEDEVEESGEEEAAAVQARLGVTHSPWRVMATCFVVVFVGEWGDITQIAIANLTAKYHDPVTVGIGSLLALSAVAGLAIKAGNTLLKKVSITLVRRVSGSVLALFALVTLAQLLT